ncbi:HlyD family type I secretion periplasmic adaptor subunit [Mesorhizobium sp. M0029]|uniref:HlyD family type I secretion periplasmic adaptor subunit n=1 Tax=Mesorhizobium sp. M0029 TaxID=2956850 RepID=UPI00333DC87B
MSDGALTYRNLSGETGILAPDSIRVPACVGLLIIIAFFAIFGGWAAFAPLNGAVLADAVVKVEGNRKSVQHFDGGTVKEIRVKDGDIVKAGDVLVVLDDTHARSEFNLYSQQYALLRATDARIRAELDGHEAVAFPKDITAEHQAYLQDAMANQIADLGSQRASMAGAKQILQKRIAELDEQIDGKQARVESFRAQLKSTIDEKAGLNKLLKAGLTTRTRVLELDRSASDLQGLIDQTLGDIAGNRQSKAELESQIAQLTNERRAKLSTMLIDAQSNLADLVPKMFAAQTTVDRAEVRAPYDGQVMNLTVFSTGAIVAPGQTILDIVLAAIMASRRFTTMASAPGAGIITGPATLWSPDRSTVRCITAVTSSFSRTTTAIMTPTIDRSLTARPSTRAGHRREGFRHDDAVSILGLGRSQAQRALPCGAVVDAPMSCVDALRSGRRGCR